MQEDIKIPRTEYNYLQISIKRARERFIKIADLLEEYRQKKQEADKILGKIGQIVTTIRTKTLD